MNSDLFTSLFAYNQWANNTLISKVGNIEPARPMLRLLSHIMNAHAIWNARLHNLRQPVGVWDEYALAGIEELNARCHADTMELLKEVDLDNVYTYFDTSRSKHVRSVGDTMFHMVNHGMHHRGQISWLIREAGYVPPGLDYIHYLRET